MTIIQWVVLTVSVFAMLINSAAGTDIYHVESDAPFIWLKAANNAKTSSVSNRDLDGDTAMLLFPFVAQQPPRQIDANFERQFKLLNELPAACSGKKIYTQQRAALGHYSELPQLFSLGLRLFVNPDSVYAAQIASLAVDNQISMAHLAAKFPLLVFGSVAGRSYTPELDTILKKINNTGHLWVRSAEDMAGGMVQMLVSQRVDAIIEYPSLMADFTTQTGIKKFNSYKITETSAFINGYILCSATDQGLALIKRFNAAIRQASQQRNYLDAHLNLFEPSKHRDITDYYNTLYGTRF